MGEWRRISTIFEKTAKVVTFLTSFRDAPSSNLDRNTASPDRSFSSIPQSFQGNAGTVSRLGHNASFPNPFRFITDNEQIKSVAFWDVTPCRLIGISEEHLLPAPCLFVARLFLYPKMEPVYSIETSVNEFHEVTSQNTLRYFAR